MFSLLEHSYRGSWLLKEVKNLSVILNIQKINSHTTIVCLLVYFIEWPVLVMLVLDVFDNDKVQINMKEIC